MSAISFAVTVYVVGVLIFFMASPVWQPLLPKKKQNDFWCYIYSLCWPLIIYLCLTANFDEQ